MRRIALTVLLLATSALPAFAYDTPKALLEALYAPYAQGDSFSWTDFDETQFRSKELNDLFAADMKEADGDMGRLDFDPYTDSQDAELSELKIGEPAITGDTAKVEVTFKNIGVPEDLMFTLVKEAEGWKVDDVESTKPEYEYSLKAIMEAPLGD